jgi:hypothetical protein
LLTIRYSLQIFSARGLRRDAITYRSAHFPKISSADDRLVFQSARFNRPWEGEKMRVRRLDHVLLAMPAGREGEARQFYQGLLGIPEATKPSDLAARGGCWFEDGELKVHLGVEKNFVPARKAHPAFLVEDLAALTATLTKAGYSISHDQPLEGYDRIFVDDPFGNRIELMEVRT